MVYECNMTIGDLTPEVFKDFKLVLNELTNEYEIEAFEDGFIWGRGKSPKGAVISALNQGIRMKDIDLGRTYVPIHECLEAIKN